jgi:hypothetical protein
LDTDRTHVSVDVTQSRDTITKRPSSRFAVPVITSGLGVGALTLTAVVSAGAADAHPTASGPASLAHHALAAERVAAKNDQRFPGHRPGKIYLGMSCGEMCGKKEPQLGRNIGVKRWYKKWDNWRGVEKAIEEDRRKHRLPWISIEGPNHGAATGWRDVGNGRYDADIRDLARVLKKHDGKPIFISFDHEPSNKAPDDQGIWWARGYNHFHDVLKQAGALRNVAIPPIMADWMFSRFNHEDNPAHWLTPGVLARAPFVAVDVYENDKTTAYGQRLPRVLKWLGRHGHPRMMIGIGETASTDYYSGTTAAKWLNRSLRWAAHHRHRIAAISYFNSTAYSRAGAYWPLDESNAKLDTFRKWLARPVYINRVR